MGDLRDDPLQPSVVLNAVDVTFAARQLPPPPGVACGGNASADAAAGDSIEVHSLQANMKQLQADNAELHREVERLRREAAQGSAADVLDATFIPNAATQGTMAVELRGIQELLKEVRRLRSEV